MKIRKLLFLTVCTSMIFLYGCSENKNKTMSESSTKANPETEATVSSGELKAIEEENLVMSNMKYLPISPTQLKETLLQKNSFLADKSEGSDGTEYIHFKNADETMDIYLGNASEKETYSVTYYLTVNNPLEKETLKNEIMQTLKTVMECLNQEYNEQLLEESINSAKIGTVSPTLEYSDQLVLDFMQEENYFSIDIKAKKN